MSKARFSWLAIAIAAVTLLLPAGDPNRNRITILEPSCVEFPATDKRDSVVVEVTQDCHFSGDPFEEDHFILELWKPDDREHVIATTTFSSTYGHFRMQYVDVTGDGLEEIVLVRGVGRGTAAREEHLVILKQENGTFRSILEKTISGWLAPDDEWHYEIHVSGDHPPVIRLTMSHPPPPKDSPWPHDALVQPNEVSYAYNKKLGIMQMVK